MLIAKAHLAAIRCASVLALLTLAAPIGSAQAESTKARAPVTEIAEGLEKSGNHDILSYRLDRARAN